MCFLFLPVSLFCLSLFFRPVWGQGLFVDRVELFFVNQVHLTERTGCKKLEPNQASNRQCELPFPRPRSKPPVQSTCLTALKYIWRPKHGLLANRWLRAPEPPLQAPDDERSRFEKLEQGYQLVTVYLMWTKSISHHLRNHRKPIVCWYLQGSHHSRVSLDGAGFRPSTVGARSPKKSGEIEHLAGGPRRHLDARGAAMSGVRPPEGRSISAARCSSSRITSKRPELLASTRGLSPDSSGAYFV